MAEFEKDQITPEAVVQETNDTVKENEEYSLNDDRRVKTLSPWRLVAKRFIRNRVAVTGLVVLIFMFLFSYLGGVLMPYRQDQIFYRYDSAQKRYAAVTENKELRYVTAEGEDFPSVAKAKFVSALNKKNPTFEANGVTYTYTEEGENFYSISRDGRIIALASLDIVSSSTGNEALPFDLQFSLLKAIADGAGSFDLNGNTYTVDDATLMLNGQEIAYASKFSIQASSSDIYLTRDFKEKLVEAIESGAMNSSIRTAPGSRPSTCSPIRLRRATGPSCRRSTPRCSIPIQARAKSIGSVPTGTEWTCSRGSCTAAGYRSTSVS